MNVYDQLYTILSEALYGSGAVLDTYQEFVLTQISTYLSYGCLLAPIICMLVFTVRLLRW